MQISLHFEELLCKNVFFLLFLYVSHSVVEGGPNCTYMCICKYDKLTSVVKALD